MIKVGEYNTLNVIREAAFGVYLDDGAEGILLPKRFVPDNTKIDDELTVFIYHDGDERLIATTQKPIGILNTDGYFNHLIAFVQHQLDEQFIKPFHQHLLIVGNTVDDLLEKMKLINDNIERNEITLE
jgi:hypothetical protein